MYFYHEGYHDAYYAESMLENLRQQDRPECDRAYEPIRSPAILTWLALVSVALCVAFTAISLLS